MSETIAPTFLHATCRRSDQAPIEMRLCDLISVLDGDSTRAAMNVPCAWLREFVSLEFVRLALPSDLLAFDDTGDQLIAV